MRSAKTAKRQGGATAIEFAFVFPLLFLFFYGSLTYGLIFLMRLGLQNSAEAGVRAALRTQIITYANGSTSAQKRQQQMLARVNAGIAVAQAQASWMNTWRAPTVTANICVADAECLTTAGTAVYPDCNASTRCQVVVMVTYPYAVAPAIPGIAGFGLLTPNTIQGRARVLFDGRALLTL
jgi:Flp pilus assembly protein TadG